jgi:flagellar basal-body rod modification protein FlgD
MVTAVNNTTTTATTTGNSARASLTNNFETFLSLLTTQLQNQDPLSPMDSTEFTNQLVQYSGVEQQLQTNDLLKSLTDLTRASAGGTAVSYLGRSVTAQTPNAMLPATGDATWNYELPRAAEKTTMKVVNSSGRTVATLTGETAAGSHVATWNGRDLSGARAPAGTYRLVVESLDASKRVVAATVSQTGIVDGVDMTGATPMISIGGLSVPLTQIGRIRS